jgi:hypothetical protein
MKILHRLERNFSWIAIPNLTIYLVLGQMLVWALQTFAHYPMEAIALYPALVAQGEVWRLITFAFFPPQMHPLFLVFAWLILFMMGNALEHFWGSFRYTLYVFSGLAFTILATVIAIFIQPNIQIGNLFISSSIFFAFAFLNPDYEFLMFFILPVKVKWLAILSGGLLLVGFLMSSFIGKIVILAGVGNFFLFFSRDLVMAIKGMKMRRENRARYESRIIDEDEPFHVCTICGITDKTDPDMHFVYSGGKGYCEKCVEKLDEKTSS